MFVCYLLSLCRDWFWACLMFVFYLLSLRRDWFGACLMFVFYLLSLRRDWFWACLMFVFYLLSLRRDWFWACLMFVFYLLSLRRDWFWACLIFVFYLLSLRRDWFWALTWRRVLKCEFAYDRVWLSWGDPNRTLKSSYELCCQFPRSLLVSFLSEFISWLDLFPVCLLAKLMIRMDTDTNVYIWLVVDCK